VAERLPSMHKDLDLISTTANNDNNDVAADNTKE
jgi:hypothetical protein